MENVAKTLNGKRYKKIKYKAGHSSLVKTWIEAQAVVISYIQLRL